MRFHPNLIALSLLFAACPPLPAQDEAESGPWPAATRPDRTDPTSLRIIDLHLQARGGRAALAAVRSLSIEGQLVEGQKDYALTITQAAPNLLRVVSDHFFKGYNYITVTGTDGDNAWLQETGPKSKIPRKLSGLDKHLLELDASLPFLLLDPDAAGAVFAYTGEAQFAQRPVYTLHGWLRNGLRIDVLLDTESFQVINYRQLYRIGDRDVVVDRVPTGLARVADTWWEKGWKYQLLGKAFREIKYFKVQAGGPVAPDTFTEPPTRERWLRGTP